MTKRTKRILWIIVIVFFTWLILSWLDAANGERGEGTVNSVKELPYIGEKLPPLKSKGPLNYFYFYDTGHRQELTVFISGRLASRDAIISFLKQVAWDDPFCCEDDSLATPEDIKHFFGYFNLPKDKFYRGDVGKTVHWWMTRLVGMWVGWDLLLNLETLQFTLRLEIPGPYSS